LIASTGGDAARDIRDRAILILLATYGFRSGEVSGLRLEDVNWEKEIISIVRPKQRRAQQRVAIGRVWPNGTNAFLWKRSGWRTYFDFSETPVVLKYLTRALSGCDFGLLYGGSGKLPVVGGGADSTGGRLRRGE
jgi:integrase